MLKIIFNLLILSAVMSSCSESIDTAEKKLNLDSIDPYLIVGEKSFLDGYEPIDEKENIQAVIEIPTGSIDKWEVEKENGNMSWELENGKPRKIEYLGYPGNYGMIPKTLLPKELGGDGDPLDVIVLGPAVERGSVIKAKIIGALKLLDRGEQDDKLIAVMKDSPFYKVNSLKELDDSFKGVSLIIETFFRNYKGEGKMVSEGFMDKDRAKNILNQSIKEFKK